MTDTADMKAPFGPLGLTLRLGGGFFLAIFGIGIAAGVLAAWREHGEFGTGGVVGMGLAALVAAGGAWLLLSARRGMAMPRSPRVRRSRIALYLSLSVSLVVGAMAGFSGFASGEIDGPGDGFTVLLSAAPLSRILAASLLAAWLLAMAVSAYWHISLDEIERAEYDFGAILALYAYVCVAPAWWLAWRGGMAPAPDGVAIFVTVCVVWLIGWAWRRWR